MKSRSALIDCTTFKSSPKESWEMLSTLERQRWNRAISAQKAAMCSIGSGPLSSASNVGRRKLRGIGLFWISWVKGGPAEKTSLSSSFDLWNSLWTSSKRRLFEASRSPTSRGAVFECQPRVRRSLLAKSSARLGLNLDTQGGPCSLSTSMTKVAQMQSPTPNVIGGGARRYAHRIMHTDRSQGFPDQTPPKIKLKKIITKRNSIFNQTINSSLTNIQKERTEKMKKRVRRGDLSGNGIVSEQEVRGEEIETRERSRGGAEGRQPHPEEEPHRARSLARTHAFCLLPR
ncbi:hypothetical protein GW17_00031739 [Ensete ventricosum]|nr:hypothetical protein GW17_00031739 [Ensete ventricosum]